MAAAQQGCRNKGHEQCRSVAKYDAILFDCDGTLYHAERAIPGAARLVTHLVTELKKKVFFVTNTSSRDRGQLRDKLLRLGFPAAVVGKEMCVPSGFFAAEHVRKKHPDARRVYLIGGHGLANEVRSASPSLGVFHDDLPLSGDAAAFERDYQRNMDAFLEENGPFDGIVVGWDQNFHYEKLARCACVLAGRRIRNTLPDEDARADVAGVVVDRPADATATETALFFYATNADPCDRVGGYPLPGAGAMLGAIAAACPHASFAVLGKPNPSFLRGVLRQHGIPPQRCLLVGDRLDTDIQMGNAAGADTLFVLSGVHTEADMRKKKISPTFVASGVGELLHALTSNEGRGESSVKGAALAAL
eukprot:g18256.t1